MPRSAARTRGPGGQSDDRGRQQHQGPGNAERVDPGLVRRHPRHPQRGRRHRAVLPAPPDRGGGQLPVRVDHGLERHRPLRGVADERGIPAGSSGAAPPPGRLPAAAFDPLRHPDHARSPGRGDRRPGARPARPGASGGPGQRRPLRRGDRLAGEAPAGPLPHRLGRPTGFCPVSARRRAPMARIQGIRLWRAAPPRGQAGDGGWCGPAASRHRRSLAPPATPAGTAASHLPAT